MGRTSLVVGPLPADLLVELKRETLREAAPRERAARVRVRFLMVPASRRRPARWDGRGRSKRERTDRRIRGRVRMRPVWGNARWRSAAATASGGASPRPVRERITASRVAQGRPPVEPGVDLQATETHYPQLSPQGLRRTCNYDSVIPVEACLVGTAGAGPGSGGPGLHLVNVKLQGCSAAWPFSMDPSTTSGKRTRRVLTR